MNFQDRKNDPSYSSKNETKRPLIRRFDLIILLILTAFSVLIFSLRLRSPAGKAWAVIRCDGRVVDRIDLSTAPEKILRYEDFPAVSIGLDGDGGIYFASSDCPDQLCVRSGILRRRGDFAACLPNKVTITLEGQREPGDPDIVIGKGANLP